ncbi:MAG: DUF5329 family protein [Deltaproteobacteria bacterium]|jgi:hypothetical protein|nr:DUF5329 family protein [Deltaproteobacteria bacterium]
MGILLLISLASPALALEQNEKLRVEFFLQALAQEKDLIFISNGREYMVNRAVNHLRRKLNSVEDKLSTAEEFIDQVASKSSLSGKSYLIRRPGGQNEEAGPYFHEILTKIPKNPAPEIKVSK